MSKVDTTDPKEIPVTTEYRVVVTRIQHNVKTRDKDYQDLGTTKTNNRGEEEKEYGYVYFDTFVDRSTEVYDQTVGDLNLQEVIKAVNGMKG